MRALISGGCGYLGSVLIRQLLAANDPNLTLVVYDDLLYTDFYQEQGMAFVRGDVCDAAHLAFALDGVDVVVWLAAIVGDAACMVNPQKAIATNQESVRWLAKMFKGPIIFPSSCSVYGVNDEVATEESPLAPQSLYAETKVKAEEYLRDANACILRLGTLYGVSPRMRFDLAVNVMAMKAATTGRIEVYGGAQYRPFLSVHDAARQIRKLLAGGWMPGVYNLASENMAILDVAQAVKEVLPQTQVDVTGSLFEDRRNYRVSSDKARRLLGFESQATVRDGVRDVATLVRSGRLRDLGDLKYSNLTALNARK
jgi:nucleoside-diphosphate-sugar epimerase